jgi:hypothetical protein
MNEHEADKVLTEAGFQNGSIRYGTHVRHLDLNEEDPLFYTIDVACYYRGNKRITLYMTRHRYTTPLPEVIIKHYENKNAEAVKEALDWLEYEEVMRYCT